MKGRYFVGKKTDKATNYWDERVKTKDLWMDIYKNLLSYK